MSISTPNWQNILWSWVQVHHQTILGRAIIVCIFVHQIFSRGGRNRVDHDVTKRAVTLCLNFVVEISTIADKVVKCITLNLLSGSIYLGWILCIGPKISMANIQRACDTIWKESTWSCVSCIIGCWEFLVWVISIDKKGLVRELINIQVNTDWGSFKFNLWEAEEGD